MEELFTWRDGDVAFVSQPVPAGAARGPRLLHLVPHVVHHAYAAAQLEAALAPHFARRVTVTPRYAEEIEGFGFEAAERGALDTILARRRLADGLVGLTAEARGLALALVFALHAVGMLRFAPES